MSKSSATNSTIRLKRDHQTSSLEESNSSIKTPSPPIKKQKQENLVDKTAQNRYPNGSSSAFLSSNSTKKLVIKNLKSLLMKNSIYSIRLIFFRSFISCSTSRLFRKNLAIT